MAKYIIRFMPEYCATSLWTGNSSLTFGKYWNLILKC